MAPRKQRPQPSRYVAKADPEGVWQDVTSFSQGQQDRTPRTWQMKVGTLRIVVTRHIHYPGEWIARCDPFFSDRSLGDIDVEDAKSEAIAMVRDYLNSAMKAVDEAIG